MSGSGGRRNRSGSAPDLSSGRSESLDLQALPREGFTGVIPAHPTDASGDELVAWESLWRTPQAAVWFTQSWRWAHVADLARLMVMVRDPESSVGAYTHLRQARADLGLTPAGLVENGWKIAADEVAARREVMPQVDAPAPRRLRAVP